MAARQVAAAAAARYESLELGRDARDAYEAMLAAALRPVVGPNHPTNGSTLTHVAPLGAVEARRPPRVVVVIFCVLERMMRG